MLIIKKYTYYSSGQTVHEYYQSYLILVIVKKSKLAIFIVIIL